MHFRDLSEEDQRIVITASTVNTHLSITQCNCANNKYNWATLKFNGASIDNPKYFVRCYRCDRTSHFEDSPDKAVLAWETELLLDPNPITDERNKTKFIF